MTTFSSTNRRIVAHYIQHRLKKENINWSDNESHLLVGEVDPVENNTLLKAIENMGEIFEKKYNEAFCDMCRQLRITEDTLQTTFLTVVDELFSGGIRWGRVVALIAFAGSYSVECVRKDLFHRLNEVCQMTCDYLDNQLKGWIDQHGGWDAFIDFSESCDNNTAPWPPISTICKVAAGAVGLITLATIFSSRS